MTIKWDLFKGFFQSEKAGGFVLMGCTIISLIIANSSAGEVYVDLWHTHLNLSFLELDYSYEHWVNDGLMAIFFLLVGLEIERELYIGELSDFKKALLPILAAAGGIVIPALLHFIFNSGTPTQSGFGIPIATDIAFALGILSLAGKKVPVSLKIFLTALAIIDDLGAITIIALFYTKSFQLYFFLGAIAVFLILFILGKIKVYKLPVYIIGGIVMWYCMLKSGVHSTISGVLLAFAIPFHREDDKNTSYHLQHFLHKPVAFIVLPIFALANTAIIFPDNILQSFTSVNSIGIITGLVAGKFLGIFLFSFLGVKANLASLSPDINWRQIAGVACLGGIGFTMSIFITNLAFNDPAIITDSKISIIFASLITSVVGLSILKTARSNQ